MESNEWQQLLKIKLQAIVKSEVLREILKTAGSFLLVTAVIATIVIGASTYGTRWGVKPDQLHPQIAGLAATAVRTKMIDEYYETSGMIKARESNVLTAKVEGRITAINAKIGDQVTAGQLIITLDDAEINQQMQMASMAQQSARQELEAAHERLAQSGGINQRYKTLYDVHAIARREQEKVEGQYNEASADVAQAQNRVDRANAAMNLAQSRLETTRITAAISGEVTEQKVNVGNNIIPGAPLMTIEDHSSFLIEGQVDADLASRLSPGQQVFVTVTGGQEEPGQITEILPSPGSLTGAYVVKASFAGIGAKSGISGSMKVPASQREALVASVAAIVTKNGQTGVFVLRPDRIISFRPVQIVPLYEQQVEIVSGLYPGEEIIVDGVERAADGGVAQDVKSL